MLELFFNTKTTFSLLRGEWRENGAFVGDKYPHAHTQHKRVNFWPD